MLKVRMLGQEEITYGDHLILLGKNKITKSMELLLLLLHRRETGIARSRLADATPFTGWRRWQTRVTAFA